MKRADPGKRERDTTLMEKLGSAAPWGRRRGRSAEEAEEESNLGARSLVPRPPPGLKLRTV